MVDQRFSYRKEDLESRIFNFMFINSNDLVINPKMKAPSAFRALLKRRGYSDEAIKEIWKWYDFSERRGINF